MRTVNLQIGDAFVRGDHDVGNTRGALEPLVRPAIVSELMPPIRVRKLEHTPVAVPFALTGATSVRWQRGFHDVGAGKEAHHGKCDGYRMARAYRSIVGVTDHQETQALC